MDKLALLGGTPVIKGELPHYNSLGEQELEAVISVMRSGCLSGFYGSWCDEFFGGPQVRAFEEAWSERFKTKHSISVNSASSGLFAAVGAAGVGPGDEVIVPPYTMSATVIAPILYGGIPVFADIEPETFCIDPDKVKECISPRTKAIIAVNLFGHPSKLRQLHRAHSQWRMDAMLVR
jgi:perosamine synthetase